MNVYRSARKQVGNRVVVTQGGAIPPFPTPFLHGFWTYILKTARKLFLHLVYLLHGF
jgi:hypothetical protein